MILEVELPDRRVLVDPTSRTASFSELPWNDQEADYLPITREGSDLLRTPASTAKQNESRIDLDLTPSNGVLEGTFHYRATGALADSLRHTLLITPAGEQQKMVANLLSLSRATVADLNITAQDPPEKPTPIEVSGKIRDPLNRGVLRMMRPSDLAPVFMAISGDHRKDPIVLKFRSHEIRTVTIHLPAGAELSSEPASFSIETPFARYSLDIKRESRSLIIKRDVTIREHIIPASSYAEAHAMSDTVSDAESRPITFRASTP